MTPLKPIENLFAVEVPGDAVPGEWKIFEVDGENYLNGMTADGEMYAGLEPLPPGSYEILFPTYSATEQHAAGVVVALWEGCYPDYSREDYYFSIAILSLQSLLRSNGLDLLKNYLLIKRNEQ